MDSLKFDEARLLIQLEELVLKKRVAFAAACSERIYGCSLMPARVAHNISSENVFFLLERLWDHLLDKMSITEELVGMIEECERLISDGESEEYSPIAENATGALYYALSCLKSNSAQDAVYAARLGYETLDNYVIDHDEIDTNKKGCKGLIRANPLIQREFARQCRDIDELSKGLISIENLHVRSRLESKTFIVE